MSKYRSLVNLILVLSFMGLISGIDISEAGVQQEDLKFAQEKSYKRIFPGSVSPEPEIIQSRDAREEMEVQVQKEKELSEARQKELMPPKGKPALIAGKPTRIYYRIAVNDKLFIAVWRVPDLSMEVIVGPDGKISFPLLGDIDAAGRTLSELDAEITEKLKEYVNDPQVSVVVREFAGDKVTVIGEVRTPGIYKFTGRTRIMDIIALASGFTDRAKSASIVIVRQPTEDSGKGTNLIVVDVKSILKGNLNHNIEVQAYDIIYVSRTFVSNVKEFYDNWITPTLNTTIDIETLRNLRKTRPKGSD